MKIILGIGNPGSRYDGTRHNVGSCVVERLAALEGTAVARKRFKSLVETVTWNGRRVLLVKPETYVNETGEAARLACDYYEVPPDALLVVVDDVNLPLGQLRFRATGSAGGHNGLKSMIERLGSEAFCRLRIGIGEREHPEQDLADHVLSRFAPDERPIIDEALERGAEGCRLWIAEGIEACMNRYN